MKTKFLVVLIAAFVLTGKSYGQFSFGVSPGIGLSGAHLGYKLNKKLIPYIGFQYLNAKFDYAETGEEFDNDLMQVVTYSNKNEFSGSLFMPTIGIKYFMKQKNKLQPFWTLSLTKPFVSGKLKTDGTEDPDFNATVKNIRMWGCEIGYGIEYFVDENFSIGGEFGFKYMHLKYNGTNQSDFWNPNTKSYQNTDIKNSFNLSTNPTFSRITLNYYF